MTRDAAPGQGLRPPAIELLLAVCALVFLGAYTYEVLARPDGESLVITEFALWATWGVFAVDWVIAFVRDRDKLAHFWEHAFGLVVVVLPTFAPLRVLRLLSLFVFLQRLLVRSPVRVTVVWYAVASSSLLIFVSSLAVLQLERADPASDINTLPDALWWALATVTTVGYGDITPITTEGKLLAAVLMVAGIALLGIVTATLASWLVDRIAEESERSESVELRAIGELHEEIAALRREVRELREAREPRGHHSDE